MEKNPLRGSGLNTNRASSCGMAEAGQMPGRMTADRRAAPPVFRNVLRGREESGIYVEKSVRKNRREFGQLRKVQIGRE